MTQQFTECLPDAGIGIVSKHHTPTGLREVLRIDSLHRCKTRLADLMPPTDKLGKVVGFELFMLGDAGDACVVMGGSK